MIKKKIRSWLSIVLVATAANLTIPIAPVAANPACVLNTDYTLADDGTFITLRFSNTSAFCNWTVPSGVTRAEVVIVGGGGSGGGNQQPGGGGGGQVLYNSSHALTAGAATAVRVGAGAIGVTGNAMGNRGGDSTFGGFMAIGGGGGGSSSSFNAPMWNGTSGGSSGGSNRNGRAPRDTTGNSYTGWTSYGTRGGSGSGFDSTNNGGMGGGTDGGSTAISTTGGGGGGGGAYSVGESSTTIISGTSATVRGGAGGSAISLMGVCLAGGGSGNAQKSSFYTTGSIAGGTASRCFTPAGVEVTGVTTGGIVGAAGMAGTGSGGGANTLASGTGNGGGGTGTVIVKYSTVLANQTITFATITDKTFNTPSFRARATTSAAGETVTVTSANVSICSYSGETVTLVSTGTCTLTASQAGSASVQAAANVVRSFVISRGTPTLGSFTSVTKTYGNSSFALDTVTSTVPGSFQFTSLNTNVLTTLGNTATIVGAGTASIQLLFTPTDSARWETRTATGTVTVNKKALTASAPNLSVEFGSARSVFSSSLLATYSGFVGSETQSVINTLATCSESPVYTTASSPVQSPFPITCSGASDDNYSFTYQSGALTVTRNDMSEYTDAQLITADRASIVYGEIVTLSQAPVGTFSGTFTGACTQLTAWTARATSASGTCTGSFTQSNLNYETRTVVISIPTIKRQLTISGSTLNSRRYDGTATAGTVTVGTLGNRYDSQTLGLSATAADYSTADAGSGKSSIVTYSITNGTGLASNYLAPVNETLTGTIEKGYPTFGAWPTTTIALTSPGETITAPTVTSPLSGGTFSYVVGDNSIATLSGTTIVPVASGSTTLTATYAPIDSTNYLDESITATLTISKGGRTLAFGTTTFSKTYGDAQFSVVATPSIGVGDGSITYSATGGGCSVGAATGLVTILAAGSCSISATISTGANYDQVSTTTPVTVTISRKTITILNSSIASRVYSGNQTPGTLTIGSLSGLVSGESLTVTARAADLVSANVGSYNTNVSYTLANGVGGTATNYLIADESITAVITKKNLRITATNASVNYGAPAPTITATYDGFVGSETATVLDTLPTCTSTYTNTTPAGSSATTSCSGAADGNYSFTYVSGSVTISTNSRTISLSISNVNLQYGETATLTSTVSAGALDGTVTYSSSQPSICLISGTSVRALSSVGTCQISASIGAGVNYSAVTSVFTAIVLSKRDLTVVGSVVSNKVYDGNETATVTSASLSGVLAGDTVQLSATARFANKNVGNSKAVTATMTISGTDSRHYLLIQPSLGNANITVKTVTVSGLSVVNRNYDSSTVAAISGAPILVGLIAGDSLTAGSFRSGTFANSGPATGIAVTTNISLLGSDSANYQLTQPSLSGDISLTVANTITITPIGNKRYGDSPFSVNATASSGLLVSLTAQGSACSILGIEVTITAVGICQITAQQPGNGTYDPAEPVVETFTVLAAEITLTVENKAIVVGSATPTNSFRVTGNFASGESIATVTYRYASTTYASSTTAPTSVGVYSITISQITLTAGNLSNYQITYVNGTYSVGSASDKNLTGMVVFVPGSPTVDYLYGNFSPTTYTYSVLLPPSATTLRVNIARSSISTFKSQVRINDSGYRTLKYSSSVGGAADSGDLPVSAATNTILILITSVDKSTLTYTINVYRDIVVRETATVTSANVDAIVSSRVAEVPTVATSVLTGITFSPALTLTPTFSLTTYAYSATVAATQSAIIVTAAFQGTGFAIKTRVNNAGFKAVNGEGRSQPLSLVKGSNQLLVRVESGDGTVAVYSFAITRL